MHSKLYIPARSAELPYTVDVTPESAGWTESSLQVLELDDSQSAELHTGDTEVMILPLAGGGTVECDGETFELTPRASVFDGPSDMVYIGIDKTTASPVKAASRSAAPARRDIRSPIAGWRPPTCPSNCVAPATAADRCTTSAPQASSRPTR